MDTQLFPRVPDLIFGLRNFTGQAMRTCNIRNGDLLRCFDKVGKDIIPLFKGKHAENITAAVVYNHDFQGQLPESQII